jgi:hypothetical protein
VTDKPEIKRRKTHPIRFTRFELLHLRDLMSVTLPPDGKQTLSQALAALEGRPMIETYLWRKISEACEEAGLPLGEEAPDYIVAPSAPPPMGVFQLAHEPMPVAEPEGPCPECGTHHRPHCEPEDPDRIFGGKDSEA